MKKSKNSSKIPYTETETLYDSQYLDELFRDLYARVERLEACENKRRVHDEDYQMPNSKRYNYTKDHDVI